MPIGTWRTCAGSPSVVNTASSVIRPWPTKLEMMSAMAVLDCTSAVTPMPEASALKRLLTPCANTLRKFAPSTRKVSLRTRWVPHTSRAMAANRFSRWVKSIPG